MTTRKLQIGVMGSAADLNYSQKIAELAEEVGAEIARNDAVLIFGAEKDYDSLSTAAARGAKKAGGLTIGITYGKGLEIIEEADAVIATGMERGGGRELVLVTSCDGIITLNGGSGTLNEIAVAYQAGIPIMGIKGSGGWTDKLAGQFCDDRKRVKVESTSTPKEAVDKIITLIKKRG